MKRKESGFDQAEVENKKVVVPPKSDKQWLPPREDPGNLPASEPPTREGGGQGDQPEPATPKVPKED